MYRIYLPRYGYSWITSVLIIVIIAAIYSYTSILNNISAFRDLEAGNEAFRVKKYEISTQNYLTGLKQAPSSRMLKIKTITSIFKSGNSKYYASAIDILSGIKLSKYEFEDLKKIMPRSYYKYLKCETE